MNEDNEKIVDDVLKQNKDQEYEEIFTLCLDSFFQDSYEDGIYPEDEISHLGHYGTCLLEHKDKYKRTFLLECAKRFEKHGTIQKINKND